jgi:NADH-quinone oxidoreductase subunit C
MAKKVLDALTKKFGDAIPKTTSDKGDEVAYVQRSKLVEVATWLRDDPAMQFDSPVFCTCIDNLGEEPRYEVCYQLRSSVHRHRVRLKIELDEDDVKCPSLAKVWPGFGWLERETYDMYGVQFEGHGDLRRIYMYDEFVGHPLRKDYPKDKRQPLVRRDDLPSN